MNKTAAIKSFLESNTKNDLASMYSFDMECQVNVARGTGEIVKGEYKGRQWSGFQDSNGNVWKSFRIPYNANSEPTYTDTLIRFSLAAHVEGIGMTGWDWFNKKSRWVAFDFDAMVGHSEKHSSKLSNDELNEVKSAAMKLPWTTIRRSTSGKGLHIYVFLDDVSTVNHTEHAAVARSILHYMSAKTGFSFEQRVDICGGNMWIWHRKMLNTDGLTLIKQGVALDHVPSNWRDHLQVVTGKRKRIKPDFGSKELNELSAQKQHIPLGDEHKALIDFLDKSGASFWWDQDHYMLVCHTYDLKQAHTELGFRGIFETLATGSEQGSDHNCFLYPMRNGTWVVRRYQTGTSEADTWDTDPKGWTRCYYNNAPDLKSVSKAHGGVEHPTGGFVFQTSEDAAKAALSLGVGLDVHNHFISRETKLKQHRDGRLVAEIKRESSDDAGKMRGWLCDRSNKFIKIFDHKIEDTEILDVDNYDDMFRHVVAESGQNLGWVIKSQQQWTDEPLQHVTTCLRSIGLKPIEVQTIVGNNIFKTWRLVNRPFEPEYIGDRNWNRHAAQFQFPPNLDKDTYNTPTWDMILNHVGESLDAYVVKHRWCQDNNLVTGGDYLRCWTASLFQFPYERLPYLFLWSEEQNTGKSILHEALSTLFTRGYVKADKALQTDFNGELENALLCVVEETDLQRNKKAYNMIKDYITSLQLSLHVKGMTPIMIPNTTHWIQCANEATACPLFKGDTRVTVINVAALEREIPKNELLSQLRKEAPDFLGAMLKLELPIISGRLNIPVLDTQDKRVISRTNETLLEMFIEENCAKIDGHMISIADFHATFTAWIDSSERYYWTKQRVSKTMHPSIPKGRSQQTNNWCYGNLSFDLEAKPLTKLVLNPKGDTLVPYKR